MTRFAFHRAKGPRENIEDAACGLTVPVPAHGDVLILVVDDGAGGHNRGEVASALGVTHTCSALVASMTASVAWGDATLFSPRRLRDLLCGVLESANAAVVEHAGRDVACEGMATTTVCGIVLDDALVVAWAGDSRCYIYNHEAGIRQVTRDHSRIQELIETGLLCPSEAAAHPEAHTITRYLGQRQGFQPQSRICRLAPGDVVLFCTDGLSDALTSADLARRCRASADRSVAELAERLVEDALAAGTTDNATALCYRHAPDDGRPNRPTSTGNYPVVVAAALMDVEQGDPT